MKKAYEFWNQMDEEAKKPYVDLDFQGQSALYWKDEP